MKKKLNFAAILLSNIIIINLFPKMNNKFTRRSFIGSSAAAIATVSFASMATSCQQAASSPSFPGMNDFGSKFGGVQIGAITYSWRNMPAGLENIVKYCKETGVNSIELMSGDLETYLGAPAPPPRVPRERGVELTPEQQEEQRIAQQQYSTAMKDFRLSVHPQKVAAAKKLFDDAGIEVHIVKFSPARWSDEEIDYAFVTAKAMGAKAVCDEIGEQAAQRMAPFAEKHGMYAILHNHAQYGQPDFSADPFLAVSPTVMLNFDCGHYFGSTGLNPCDFIKKYHERIFSIHIKDKTGMNTDPKDENQVWGQGETPLAEVLLLIKNEGWPIYLDIELEYDIKPWSNQVKETKTCVQYARNILI